MRRTLATLTAAAILAAAGACYGAPLTETFTYQGQLEDTGELANGSYDFRFQLFDAASGGTPVGSQIFRTNQAVADGLFNLTVNFGGIGLIFDGQRRWLEVAVRPAGVGSYAVMGPRQEMTTTPYAAYALNAQTAETAAFAADADITLHDAYANGPTIDAKAGEVAIVNSAGGISTPAVLRLGKNAAVAGGGGELVVTNSSGNPAVELSNLSDNSGIVQVINAVGTPIVNLQRDTSAGGGGYINAYRRDSSGSGSSIGFEAQGNYAGTESAFVTIRGNTTTMFFDSSSDGDASAVLDSGAINATEILNEVGAASETFSSSFSVADAVGSVISRTITCPTSGYVLVIGSGEVALPHTNGTTTRINFGVSDTSTVYSVNTDIDVGLPSGAASGTYYIPATSHGLFSVTSGAHTFYLNADHDSGSGAVISDAQLTCVFIPTSYGTITPTLLAPDGGRNDGLGAHVGPMTQDDILMEREVSVLADEQRRADELAAVREQVARLEARLAEVEREGH
ncbi:MAG: hypothetical protein R3B49_01930 [Phycisphaerales bacterium]